MGRTPKARSTRRRSVSNSATARVPLKGVLRVRLPPQDGTAAVERDSGVPSPTPLKNRNVRIVIDDDTSTTVSSSTYSSEFHSGEISKADEGTSNAFVDQNSAPDWLRLGKAYQGFCPFASYCNSISEPIPRIPYTSLTPKQFFDQFVRPRRPCILTVPSSDQAIDAHEGLSQLAPLFRLWTKDSYLCEAAGNVKVDVEYRDKDHSEFGASHRKRMPFGEVINHIANGGEKFYLTTQNLRELRTGVNGVIKGSTVGMNDILVTESVTNSLGPAVLAGDFLTQTPLKKDYPEVPSLLKTLVPIQYNLWFGNSVKGSSTGLHHDFHDNFYITIRGQKTFRLFSPRCAEALGTHGKVVRIHPNGLISYDRTSRCDGVHKDAVYDWRVKQIKEELKVLQARLEVNQEGNAMLKGFIVKTTKTLLSTAAKKGGATTRKKGRNHNYSGIKQSHLAKIATVGFAERVCQASSPEAARELLEAELNSCIKSGKLLEEYIADATERLMDFQLRKKEIAMEDDDDELLSDYSDVDDHPCHISTAGFDESLLKESKTIAAATSFGSSTVMFPKGQQSATCVAFPTKPSRRCNSSLDFLEVSLSKEQRDSIRAEAKKLNMVMNNSSTTTTRCSSSSSLHGNHHDIHQDKNEIDVNSIGHHLRRDSEDDNDLQSDDMTKSSSNDWETVSSIDHPSIGMDTSDGINTATTLTSSSGQQSRSFTTLSPSPPPFHFCKTNTITRGSSSSSVGPQPNNPGVITSTLTTTTPPLQNPTVILGRFPPVPAETAVSPFSKKMSSCLMNDEQSLEQQITTTMLENYIEVTLKDHDMLYLPASWFHEVISESSSSYEKESTTSLGHMAFNFWFYPPSCGSCQSDMMTPATYEDPYPDEFCRQRFRKMQQVMELQASSASSTGHSRGNAAAIIDLMSTLYGLRHSDDRMEALRDYMEGLHTTTLSSLSGDHYDDDDDILELLSDHDDFSDHEQEKEETMLSDDNDDTLQETISLPSSSLHLGQSSSNGLMTPIHDTKEKNSISLTTYIPPSPKDYDNQSDHNIFAPQEDFDENIFLDHKNSHLLLTQQLPSLSNSLSASSAADTALVNAYHKHLVLKKRISSSNVPSKSPRR